MDFLLFFLLLMIILISKICGQNGYAPSACPNSCSGHGYCNQGTTCLCFDGWNGGNSDCSLRECPKGIAWADKASGLNTGHQSIECSNAGYCNRITGQCECFSGFYGVNCQRITCPNDCNSNGVCSTISQIHDVYGDDYFNNNTVKVGGGSADGVSEVYTGWEKDSVAMCYCGHGRTGYDCSERMCPKDDDPLTKNQTYRSFSLNIRSTSAMGGDLRIKFQNDRSTVLHLTSLTNTSCSYSFVKSPKFDTVDCHVISTDNTNVNLNVTIKSWPYYSHENNLHSHNGNPPLKDFQCDTSRTTGGVTCQFYDLQSTNLIEYDYCSKRGICDFNTGLCKCFKGFGGVSCNKFTYDGSSSLNTLPAKTVSVGHGAFDSTLLQVTSERAASSDFEMLRMEANKEPVFFVRGDGSLDFPKLSVQSGGLMIGAGGLTVASDGMLIKNDRTSGNDYVLGASTLFTTDSTTPPLQITSATLTPNASFIFGAFTKEVKKFTVRNDGNTNFWDVGLRITGGITINSDGMKISGGVTVLSDGVQVTGGVNFTTGGLRISDGLTVSSQGLRVYNGGATITAAGLKVNHGGLTIDNDGLEVRGGGLTVVAGGGRVTNGISVFTGGLKVTGGVSLLRQGFYVTGGATINADGLTVTGGFTMPDVYTMKINVESHASVGTNLTLSVGGASENTGGRLSIISGAATHSSSGDILIQTQNAGDGTYESFSGMVVLSTGSTNASALSSGGISIGSGNATSGVGGAVSITVGKSYSEPGSDLFLEAGDTGSNGATGGSIYMTSGYSGRTSSGSISIYTANNGASQGISGTIVMSTGLSTTENSGTIEIGTGSSTGGKAGVIQVIPGATESQGGSPLTLKAGSTSNAGGAETGGKVIISTGKSGETSSGDLSITTPNSAANGVSGAIVLSTGDTDTSNSGAIRIGSGHAVGGAGGNITIGVGDSQGDVGSDILVYAGDTSTAQTGGYISVTTGQSDGTSSGSLFLHTANSGATGYSGHIVLSTGSSTNEFSGDLLIGTGSATGGAGGSITMSVGTSTDTSGNAGGSIEFIAGSTSDATKTGGQIKLSSGSTTGANQKSGNIIFIPGTSSHVDTLGGTFTIHNKDGANAALEVSDQTGVKFLPHPLTASSFIHLHGEANDAGMIRMSSPSNRIIKTGLEVTDGMTVNNNGLDVKGMSTMYGVVVSEDALDVTGGMKVTDITFVHNNGLVVADGGMSVVAGGMLITDGLTVFTAGLKVDNGLDVKDKTYVTGGVVVQDTGLTVVAGGVKVNNLHVTDGVTVNNAGLRVKAGGIDVEAGGFTVSAGGMNIDLGGLTLTSGDLTVHDSGLDIDAGRLTITANGLNVEAKGATIAAGGLVHNGGSTTTLVVTDGGATVHGGVVTSKLEVTNGFTVHSDGLSLTGATIDMAITGGLTTDAGDVSVYSAMVAAGLTVATGALEVASGGVDITNGGLTIVAGTNGGTPVAGLKLQNSGLKIKAGDLSITEGMTITGNLVVESDATMYALGVTAGGVNSARLTVADSGLFIDGGALDVTGALDVANGLTLSSTSIIEDDVTVSGSAVISNGLTVGSGVVVTAGDIDVVAGGVTSSAGNLVIENGADITGLVVTANGIDVPSATVTSNGVAVDSGDVKITSQIDITKGLTIGTTLDMTDAVVDIATGGLKVTGGFTVGGGLFRAIGTSTLDFTDVNAGNGFVGTSYTGTGVVDVTANGISVMNNGFKVGSGTDGGVTVGNSGLAVTGGLTVKDSDIDIADSMIVQTGGTGLYAGSDLKIGTGLTVSGGKLHVIGNLDVAGNLNVRDIEVSNKLTIEKGTPAFGLAVANGISVKSNDAVIAGGLKIDSGNLVVTNSLTISSGSLTGHKGVKIDAGGLETTNTGDAISVSSINVDSGDSTFVGSTTAADKPHITLASGGFDINGALATSDLTITAGGLHVQTLNIGGDYIPNDDMKVTGNLIPVSDVNPTGHNLITGTLTTGSGMTILSSTYTTGSDDTTSITLDDLSIDNELSTKRFRLTQTDGTLKLLNGDRSLVATGGVTLLGDLWVGDPNNIGMTMYNLIVQGNNNENVDARSSSDRRLKTDFEKLPTPLDKVCALDGVTWKWNHTAFAAMNVSVPGHPLGKDAIGEVDPYWHGGLLAQQLKKVLPVAVMPSLLSNNETEYYAIDYNAVVSLLIAATKELDDNTGDCHDLSTEEISLVSDVTDLLLEYKKLSERLSNRKMKVMELEREHDLLLEEHTRVQRRLRQRHIKTIAAVLSFSSN